MFQRIAIDVTDEDRLRGFNGEIRRFDNILALPHSSEEKRPRQLIATESKKCVYLGTNPVFEDAETHLADPSQATAELKGKYVFGGFVRQHFGHFLIECLAPVWGLDHVPDKIDGLVFLTLHDPAIITDRARTRLENFSRTMLRGFGVHVPLTFIYEPTKIEQLFLPENGIGFEDKFVGSSLFRSFFRKRNAGAKNKPPKKTAEKIYISRTKVGPRKGHLIGEKSIEKTFGEAGYRIFFPEDHDLENQLEIYRNADVIVGVEGSALHLPPFSINHDAKVAIISRRTNNTTLDETFAAQFREFAGIEPFVVGKHFSFFQPPGANRVLYNCLTVTDFDHLYSGLIDQGFLANTDILHYPRPEDLSRQIALSSKASKRHYEIFEAAP